MKQYPNEQIRSLVLLGHGSTGKTSLSEAMLFASGAVSRMGDVDEGNTVSDYEPDEVKRRISVNLSLLPCEWNGCKINVIDTPGYADFVGEVKAGIAAADAAAIVVCAASGVQVGTEQARLHVRERARPSLIFVNRMDRENADFFQTLSQLKTFFGKNCVPLQIPIGAQHDFEGVVDLIEMKAHTGDKGAEGDIPADLADAAKSNREQLVEAIAETDDELINKYLEGEELSAEELKRGLRQGIASGNIVPVLTGSATKNIGVSMFLDALVNYAPSPRDMPAVEAKNAGSGDEEPLAAEADGPLAALVFKTTADPYVGKLTYLRVYSGTLKADSHVWNAGRGVDERIGQLYTIRGKSQEQTPEVVAGDIGAVAKLSETSTGDTLCSRERPLALPAITFPEPAYAASVHPKTKADVDKMGPSLARIAEEDPTLKVRRDPDTNETVLSGLGESHVEVAAEKMKRKFGVEVEMARPKVPYKETITVSAAAEYTHKKQTGGHGQYARVAIELEPLPRGTGFEFDNRIVGGVVPRTYIPAVEKGVVEATHEGVMAHFPLIDVKATLFDGKDHPVDSSEIAFKIAGSQALKDAAQRANPVLLEPIVNMRIVVPEANTGDVMSDLNSKRAKVMGMSPEDSNSVIEAQAPLAEVLRYATDLRSITQGRGSYTVAFSHYEEVPAHLAQKVIDEASKEREG